MQNVILSIVIVNWNSKDMTLQCLDSITNISDFDRNRIEIILVDNNSNDGSKEEIKKRYSLVHLIENHDNSGYAPACNQGMKVANGKFVLLLGNDTVLKNGSLTNSIEFLEKNENCGAVGCRLVYPDGSLQGNCKKFPFLKNALFTYLSLNNLNKDYDMAWFGYDKVMEVEQIATTFLMVKNHVLRKIDYFDEQYKILYNDVDLCKKIYNSGFKIYFVPEAEIVHYGSHSTVRAGFIIRKTMYKDIFRYYKNNFGMKSYLLVPILSFRLILVSIFKQNLKCL